MVIVRVLVVSPGIFVQVMPPVVDSCHCNSGVGLPSTSTVKVTLSPIAIVWVWGWVVKDGGEVTVRTASFDVAFGSTPFEAIAR